MPGRSSGSYRYGFNGQEEEAEFWGGAISFEYRVQDPRSGRFFSVDPIAADYPWNSPYAFAENRVIDGIDLEGLEWAGKILKAATKAAFKKATKEFIENGIKARLKNYASKKWAKQLADDAISTVDLLESSWWEIAIEFVPLGIGDAYAVGSTAYKIYKVQRRLEKLETLTHYAVKAADKAWKKIDLDFSKLSSKTQESLGKFQQKFNNIGENLNDSDMAGATKDIFDEPVVINGKTFNHLGEVTQALTHMNNRLAELSGAITRGDYKGDELKAAEALYDKANQQRIEIQSVIDSAKQAAKAHE